MAIVSPIEVSSRPATFGQAIQVTSIIDYVRSCNYAPPSRHIVDPGVLPLLHFSPYLSALSFLPKCKTSQ